MQSFLPKCFLDGCSDSQPRKRTKLRVGSCVGILDTPLEQALTQKKLIMPGVAIEWITCPFDIGAFVSMINGGLVDLALMFSEDVAGHFVMGSSLKVCGTFVDSHRHWGVYTSKDSGVSTMSDLSRSVLAIPTGLGAELMTAMISQKCGCALTASIKTEVADSLASAVRAVEEREASAVLWEKSGSLEFFTSDKWRLLGEFVMPWPSVLFVATRDSLQAKGVTMRNFVDFTHGICEEFRLNKDNQSVRYLGTLEGVGKDDALSWLNRTSWVCSHTVDITAISTPLEYIQCFETPCQIRVPRDPSRICAEGVSITRALSETARVNSALDQSGSDKGKSSKCHVQGMSVFETPPMSIAEERTMTGSIGTDPGFEELCSEPSSVKGPVPAG